MSIKQQALDALILYLDAHEAWNKAQTDQAAKAKRSAHTKLIEVAQLYRPQHRPQQKTER